VHIRRSNYQTRVYKHTKLTQYFLIHVKAMDGPEKNNLLEPVWSEEEIMPRASVDILENYNMAGV